MNPADPSTADLRHELEPSPRWVRVRFGGQFVADSRRVLLLREPGRIPVYYFPRADVRADVLMPAGHTAPCPREGAACWTVRVGDRTAEHAAWSYPDPPPGRLALRDHIDLRVGEDGRLARGGRRGLRPRPRSVQAHRRPPQLAPRAGGGGGRGRGRHATPVRSSSRRGCRPATTCPGPTSGWTSSSPPTPRRGARTRAWRATTRCGPAARLVRDIAWYYRHPIPECAKIENLVCFFNERVDAIYVDGERQPRPKTRWSDPATGEPEAGRRRGRPD